MERHIPALDGVRGVAVAEVFLYHAFNSHRVYGYWPVVRLGYLGVEVFFVLSGFLITQRLFALDAREDLARSARWGHFLARRLARTAPLYYATLLAVAVIGPALRFHVLPAAWPWFLVFAMNFLVFLRSGWVGAGGHFWSLCVEEQFYLVFPAMVLTRARRWIVPVVVALALASTGLRILQGMHRGLGEWGFVLPILHLDALCAGILAAVAVQRGTVGASMRRWIDGLGGVAAVTFLCVAAMPGGRTWAAPVLHASLCVATSVSMAALWSGRFAWIGAILAVWPMQKLGKISYGFYVFHLFAIVALWQYRAPWLPPIAVVRGVIAFALSLALSAVSWRWFERPLLRAARKAMAHSERPVFVRDRPMTD